MFAVGNTRYFVMTLKTDSNPLNDSELIGIVDSCKITDLPTHCRCPNEVPQRHADCSRHDHDRDRPEAACAQKSAVRCGRGTRRCVAGSRTFPPAQSTPRCAHERSQSCSPFAFQPEGGHRPWKTAERIALYLLLLPQVEASRHRTRHREENATGDRRGAPHAQDGRPFRPCDRETRHGRASSALGSASSIT